MEEGYGKKEVQDVSEGRQQTRWAEEGFIWLWHCEPAESKWAAREPQADNMSIRCGGELQFVFRPTQEAPMFGRRRLAADNDKDR